MHVESIYLLYQTNVFLYRKVIVINHSEVEEIMISVILGLENGISHYNLRQHKLNRGQEKLCFQKPNRFECLIAGMSK